MGQNNETLAHVKLLPSLLMHDQPMCCPKCGQRTEWFGEEPQHHSCACGYHFLVYEDEDFGFIEEGDGWVSETDLV